MLLFSHYLFIFCFCFFIFFIFVHLYSLLPIIIVIIIICIIIINFILSICILSVCLFRTLFASLIPNSGRRQRWQQQFLLINLPMFSFFVFFFNLFVYFKHEKKIHTQIIYSCSLSFCYTSISTIYRPI